jgi:Required for nuclear transport of RNA pol II C-terminus 1/Required for nuclear transport of RNA pol II C-terminus 2
LRNGELEEQYHAPAGFLLQILLQLSPDGSHLRTIAKNIMYLGNRDPSRLCWTYKASGTGIQIEELLSHEETLVDVDELDMIALDKRVESFIELLKPLKENDFVSELFLSLCKGWLLSANKLAQARILTTPELPQRESDDVEGLINVKIMHKMMDLLPNRLIGDSMQALELSDEVLREAVRRGVNLDDDDTVAVTLSLLNIVFTSASFNSVSKGQNIYKSIRSSLESISRRTECEVSSTARNLLLLLHFQAADVTYPESTPDKDFEDRKFYNLGLSYLESADSPPPVRAQGLDLISGLVASNSAILDIPAILILLSLILQDDDEYIYLKVIKCFILLSIKHPKAVIHNLIERYVDSQEEASLDTRLRLGEALLQVVQKAGETLTGDLARETGSALLSIAGRRGCRPKGEVEKQKRAELSKKRNKEAEEAWDGPVPQIEEPTIEDQILGKIVEGWEGKRGEEDVRIRASALSLFGSALETNVAGMGSAIISSAVDLSINVLALELEPEKAILRRSAILLVMSLLRALDKAQEGGKRLGFGFAGQSLDDVLRILQYISGTDSDGLVRQHAKDVMEGLRTWQVKSLVGGSDKSMTELRELAGLSVNLGGSSAGAQRPRIEEIE